MGVLQPIEELCKSLVLLIPLCSVLFVCLKEELASTPKVAVILEI